MSNKTCGECKYLDGDRYCNFLDFEPKPEMGGCANFEPKPTNGDRIRHGSDKELVIYKHEWSCHVCIYHDEKNKGCHCRRPPEKTCLDGMIAWLNAPAESEVE